MEEGEAMIDPQAQTRLESDPYLGRTVDGFRIEELVGRGGMGAVYKATQLSLGRDVALKLLPPAADEDAQYLERFWREADVLSKLSHPNVVSVIDRGEVDGRPYLVMEFVPGRSLREVVRDGPLSPDEALSIVRSVLSALEHAHRQGVVHRDIKPENVLLGAGGVVKVADFGLSRVLGPDEVTRLTRTHTLLGTYEYMAPEQRERSREADARSDLYATGVVLYEAIAGELPIGHFDPLSRKRPGLCDERVDAIVQRSLEKNPDRRYQDATEMGDAVSGVLDGVAPTPGTREALRVGATERARFNPLRFATRLDTLATITNLIGFAFHVGALVWVFAATAGGAFEWTTRVPDSSSLRRVGPSLAYAVPGLAFCMLGWFATATAEGLRRFRPEARPAQGILAFLVAPTFVLLPYSLFSWWLHGFRGRVYYDGRAGGLTAAEAVTSITQTALGDPDAPLSRASAGALESERREHAAWGWAAAFVLSALWVAGFGLYRSFYFKDGEILSLTAAVLGTFWLFVAMPRLFRSGPKGPFRAVVGIAVFAAVSAIAMAATMDQVWTHVR